MAITSGYGFSLFGSAINHSIACDKAVSAFYAQDIANGDGATVGNGINAGFYGKLSTVNSRNYNFYADGNAPNYFRGNAIYLAQLSISASWY